LSNFAEYSLIGQIKKKSQEIFEEFNISIGFSFILFFSLEKKSPEFTKLGTGCFHVEQFQNKLNGETKISVYFPY